MFRSWVLLFAVAFALIVRVCAQCQSYGYDFVDGGSYFQNISSTDDFTFISFFEGCEGEGSITPILVDPNENEYFCSDIDTSPDDTLFNSTWYALFKHRRCLLLTLLQPHRKVWNVQWNMVPSYWGSWFCLYTNILLDRGCSNNNNCKRNSKI